MGIKVSPSMTVVMGLLLCVAQAVHGQVDSTCRQWQMTWKSVPTIWTEDPQLACKLGTDLIAADPSGYYNTTNYNFRNWSGTAVLNSGFPNYSCNVSWEHQRKVPANSPWNGPSITNWAMQNRPNPGGCQKYSSAAPNQTAQPIRCNAAKVGDPIIPSSGAVCHVEVDVRNAGSLTFKRFYNSKDIGGGTYQPGWRHSFSRSIKPKYSGGTYRGYTAMPANSSLYNTEALACTSGFNQIKGQVSTWASATASYSGGICSVMVGSTKIATLPIFYTSPPTPAPGTKVLIGLDATRDDGQLVSFTVESGVVKAPPGISMKLQQVAGGYSLTDEDDNVESYNTNGRLVSITSRSGVVQTMGYDTGGKLITVTDSFGHSLTLTYDPQARISSVTGQ